MADISLLFDVAGGGSLDGASGVEIKKQLDKLVENINKKPFEIKFAADANSLSVMQKQIEDMVKKALDNTGAGGGSRGSVSGSSIKSRAKSGNKSKDYTNIREISGVVNSLRKVLDKNSGFSNTGWYNQLSSAVGNLSNDLNEAVQHGAALDDQLKGGVFEHLQEARLEAIKFKEALNSVDPSKVTFDMQPDKLESTTKDIERLINLSDKYLTNYTKAKHGSSRDSYARIGEIKNELDNLLGDIKGSVKEETVKKVEAFEKELHKLGVNIKNAGEDTKTFAQRVSEIIKRFSEWFSVTRIVTAAYQLLRRMISSVIELDSAMTELKKVTNETDQRYKSFLRDATTRAKQLGAALTDTVQATADFARLGYSISDAEKMADAAIIYKNVGDGIQDINEASESIIATMQAFGISASNVMSIVDKFNNVGNNFAISSSGIGDALLRSAAAMHSAGNTIDETIALATAANTIVQNPETVGTTLKTISMYLRAAKTEAEEAGESTEGMASSVSELREEILALTGKRVDIMIDEDTFKSTYQIMKELSEVWNQLSDASHANILEMVGGKRNANIVSALLESFDVAENALATSLDSVGSAVAENEKQLDSIQGRISQLQASFESLSATVVNSELVKFIVGAGASIISVLEKIIQLFGGLEVILPSIAVLFTSSNLSSIVGLFSGLKMNTGWLNTILASLTKNLNVFKALFSSITTGSAAASSALTMLGGTTAVVSASISALTAVIGLLAAAYMNVKRKQEEARQEMIDGAKEASTYSDELSQLYSEYMALAAVMGDAEETTQELVSVQDAIIGKLGLHGSRVDELIEKYGSYQKAITEATKEELRSQRLIMLGATSSYEKDIIDTYNSSKTIDIGTSGDLVSFMKQNYESLVGSRTNGPVTQFHIGMDRFGHDLNTVDGVISTYNDIYELLDNLEYNGFSDTKLFTELSRVYTDLKDSIDEYRDHMDNLDDNLLQTEFLNTISAHGMPTTQKEFDEFKRYLSSSISMTDAFAGSYENVTQAVEDFLSKQSAFSEFFKEIADTAENSTTNALKKFKNSIDMIESAVNEFNSSGSVTSETYNKLIALGEDYADLFTFTNGKIELQSDATKSLVEDLVNEYGAMLAVEGAGEDDIAMLSAYASVLSSFTGETEDVTSSIESLVSTLNDMRDGTSLGTVELHKLLNQYPELSSAIISTADGYQIEEQAILDLITQKSKLIKINNLLLSQQAKAARESLIAASNNAATAANIDYIISKYNVTSFDGGANSYVNAWMKYYGKSSAPDNWISGVKEYVEAVLAEREYEKTVENLLKQITTGDYKNGTTDTNKDTTKSAFEKEYDRHQHLLAMEQESVASYVTWLSKAYKSAYNSGQIGLEDFYKYQEEVYEKNKTLRSDAFNKNIDKLKFNIEVLKHDGADDQEILSSWKSILSKINNEIAYYEKYGVGNYGANTTNEILTDLKNEAWAVQDEIASISKSVFENEYRYHQHLLSMDQENTATYLTWLKKAYEEAYKSEIISLDEYYQYQEEYYDKYKTLRYDNVNKSIESMKFDIEVLKHNNADDEEIIASWQAILSKINREIAYYETYGAQFGKDAVNEFLTNLKNEAWATQEEIASAIESIVRKAEEALTGFTSFYSTMTDVAKEYASTGALSTESLQKILELEPKYLEYLQDENGHLTINEASLREVIAAKADDLAATNALTFAKEILIATQEGDIATLTELTKCSASAASGTWDMAYATLELAKATAKASGIDESYYTRAEDYIDKMKAIAATTARTVSAYYDTLKSGYTSAADGLDQILSLTQELIKWETENKTKELEAEKEAYQDIIDKKKEVLALSREQEKHDSSTADKLKEISKLQARIDQLALDDSREAKAQKAQLESELAEKQKELADEQSDYAYDKQVEALDKQAKAFEESKDKEIDSANSAVLSTERLYQMAINRINNEWDTLYGQLLTWNESYGSTLQSEVVSAWDAAASAVQKYGSFVGALDGVKNDTVIGDTVSSNYASSIVDTMKKNSSLWLSATPEQQQALADKNAELGALLAKYLGRSVTRGADGVWMIDGMKLYDIYHTGGIVGRNGTISQNETMALLENGEMVLDDDKQSFLMSAIGFFEELSNRIGSKIDISKLGAFTAGSGYSSNLKTMMDELNGAAIGEFDFHPEVSVYISHNGEMTESDAKRYGTMAAESVLDKLSSAFSRRGILHTGNNLVKT